MGCPVTDAEYCWACSDIQYRKCMTLAHSCKSVARKMGYDKLGPTSIDQPDAVKRDWDWILSPHHYTEDGNIKEVW